MLNPLQLRCNGLKERDKRAVEGPMDGWVSLCRRPALVLLRGTPLKVNLYRFSENRCGLKRDSTQALGARWQ
ncbi:hypothetical protein DPEC_G00139390 [Dallia pectoralis]|uniref:Uncharacterized protein n=1 Tax=Dallia pectoralis TaxID=75939 RepID=A0ACC2GM86_DALPE|nr:hypothetical protein DPEC_G00139390 [Dallia pectoralis]